MKLIELVGYFRKKGSFEEFCKTESVDLDSEVIEIYMKKPFNLDNDIFFFEIEKTEGNIQYVLDNVTYFNLFDFYYFIDTIEESNSEEKKSLTDAEIAECLFSYAIHDA